MATRHLKVKKLTAMSVSKLTVKNNSWFCFAYLFFVKKYTIISLFDAKYKYLLSVVKY